MWGPSSKILRKSLFSSCEYPSKHPCLTVRFHALVASQCQWVQPVNLNLLPQLSPLSHPSCSHISIFSFISMSLVAVSPSFESFYLCSHMFTTASLHLADITVTLLKSGSVDHWSTVTNFSNNQGSKYDQHLNFIPTNFLTATIQIYNLEDLVVDDN